MKNFYNSLLMISALFVYSCSSDDPDPGTPPEPDPVSPVVFNLDEVPYATLSDYNFYEVPMKNLQPVYGVLPYDLINPLFVDYSHKKRFLWMPADVSASYVQDGDIFEFPTGTVLIKNFYYDNVLPQNSTQILETRLMIKKPTGWIFAEYVWNEEQTEAVLDMNGSFKTVNYMHEGSPKTVNYRIPSEFECFTCHKINETNSPIGPKPQNINHNYTYANGPTNQIQKWIQFGYLNSNVPSSINTVTRWDDTTQPVQDRVRGFLDINCAHCHSQGAHCDYTPIRFAWNETQNFTNLGVCVDNVEPVDGFDKIIKPGDINRSVLFFRLTTNLENYRMPLLGRTVVHDEAVALFDEWISGLDPTLCQ